MISLIHITNQPEKPMLPPMEAVSQYDLLAAGLAAQTFPDWEAIIIDQFNELPRPELKQFGERVRYGRPPATPWLDLGAFSPANARDAGLRMARGSIAVGLDDCAETPPRLLEAVAGFAEKGRWLAPMFGPPGTLMAGGVSRHTVCGGLVAYPVELALAMGGHDRRFDGCRSHEDWEFSRRLGRAGCQFITDGSMRIVLHPHRRIPPRIFRCADLVYALLKDSEHANEPWRPEQMRALTGPCPCGLPSRTNQPQCTVRNGHCRFRDPVTDQGRQTPDAIRIVTTWEAKERLELLRATVVDSQPT